MAENGFRHLVLFLIPILSIGAVGVMLAKRSAPPYRSSGTLIATVNPLLGDQVIGNNFQQYETPAAGTSRLINEQLRSDSFIKTIADAAGLSKALDSGLVTTDVIRSNVWATARGASLLSVTATWADPATTARLVNATIDSYTNYVAESVASDSSAAKAFYEQQKREAQSDVAKAEVDLKAYSDTLPPLARGEDRPIEVQLQLERLSAVLEDAQARVTASDSKIAEAQLAVDQSRSEAGRNLRVVDAPNLPTAPESTLIKQAITILVFLVIGALVSGVALFLTTLLDQSVRTLGDVQALASSDNVAIIPVFRPAKRPVAGRIADDLVTRDVEFDDERVPA
jgi:uncharacterized protein involved in exopolysaccharide biosynthesis